MGFILLLKDVIKILISVLLENAVTLLLVFLHLN